MRLNYLTAFVAIFILLFSSLANAKHFDSDRYICNYSNTVEEKNTSACSVTILNVTAQNCTGATNFTAEWLVEFIWADSPGGDIMIQRNSDPAQVYSPAGSPGTFTITGVPADGGDSDIITVYFANDVACADSYTITRPLPCPTSLPYDSGEICDNLVPTQIGGTIFDDGNYDADFQLVDVVGVIGVSVTAYNSRGEVVATTFSDANGNYVFSGMTEEHYRIEFILPDAISNFKKVTQNGTGNRTTVQFKRPGECASLGIAPPADYCEGTPWIAVPCYNFGDRIGNMGDAFVTYPVDPNASATPSTENMLSMSNVRHLATHEDIGGTHGVAYSQTRRAVYTSAYMKRHVSFGPNGTGAIYSIDPYGERPTSVLVDLNTIFGANTTGANPHNYISGNPCPGGGFDNCWFNDVGTDSTSWYSVGRISFGDIEISDDETTLYAMNMANRTVYKIPVDNPTAGSIDTYAFPLDQDTDPNVTINCGDPAGSIRPMGLAWNNGKLYVGATCTDFVANTSAPLEGGSVIYVYEFDPLDVTLTQGMRVMNHQTGALTQAYDLGASAFGKTSGLGDIEMICAPAPLMIGNRIWLDQNGDGIQTPGEPGIGGVVMSLFASDGTKIAEVKSDANGNYYFTDASLTEYNSGKLFLLNPNTQYYVTAGTGQFNTTDQTLLDVYKLTTIVICF